MTAAANTTALARSYYSAMANGDMRGDQVSLLLVSEAELISAGLWQKAPEILQEIRQMLCSGQDGWSSKAILAPTDEQTAEFLDLTSETRRRYEGISFDYKLNVLSALAENGVGFKAVGANVLNQDQGLPRACALYVLYDRLNMQPRTIIRSALLSALRTAAYACIVRELCRARVVALLGSGQIACTLARLWALLECAELEEIRVYSPNIRIEQFRVGVGPAPYRLVRAGSAKDAVIGADMLVTATTSSIPVFDSSWLGPAVHVNLGGHEAPFAFVDRCARAGSIIVDTLEGTLQRGTQSLAIWLSQHDPPPTGLRVHTFTASDWDVLDRPWHVSCVGRADLDVAVALHAEVLARRAGLGQVVML
jgi:ornithine cyclodeaminase/alanine dehydrogenase-like protein (mu-crystallin family)